MLLNKTNKPYLKQEQNSWIALGLFSMLIVLILFAMFSTIDNFAEGRYISDSSPSITIRHSYPFVNFDFSFFEGIRLMVLGIFSGLIGGMMGMGGGIVKTSGLLIIFGAEVLMARSIALITNIFIYGSAAYQHTKKNGLIIKKVVELMIPGALIGVIFGFLIGNILHTTWLKRFLGLFAIFSALDMLRRMYFSNVSDDVEFVSYEEKDFKKENKIRVAGAGFPMGTVMGLFGISGGVIGVPYQRFLLKIPMKNAIANTSVTSFIASTFAALLSFWYEYSYGQYGIFTPLIMALWIIPGNVIGAQAGAYLTGILPLKFIKLLYVAMMFIIGVRLF